MSRSAFPRQLTGPSYAFWARRWLGLDFEAHRVPKARSRPERPAAGPSSRRLSPPSQFRRIASFRRLGRPFCGTRANFAVSKPSTTSPAALGAVGEAKMLLVLGRRSRGRACRPRLAPVSFRSNRDRGHSSWCFLSTSPLPHSPHSSREASLTASRQGFSGL